MAIAEGVISKQNLSQHMLIFYMYVYLFPYISKYLQYTLPQHFHHWLPILQHACVLCTYWSVPR